VYLKESPREKESPAGKTLLHFADFYITLNTIGKVILSGNTIDSKIDTSTVPKGIYILVLNSHSFICLKL
jgi:hypothetical protein